MFFFGGSFFGGLIFLKAFSFGGVLGLHFFDHVSMSSSKTGGNWRYWAGGLTHSHVFPFFLLFDSYFGSLFFLFYFILVLFSSVVVVGCC